MRFFLGEAEPNLDQYKIIFAIFRFDDRRRLSYILRIYKNAENIRFHIDSKHAPEDCGLANPNQGIPIAPNFPERCKELGITYVAGGACQLQHNHFMFVETDDMDKLRDLMLPMMGIWDITVTPVKERA